MYVGRIMHKKLVSVKPQTSLSEAIELTEKNKIDHLLVFDDEEKLKGIVSTVDLKQTIASPATTFSTHELNYLLDQVTVETFMTKKVITIPPDTTVERAAYIMRINNISALPVVEEDKTVGIITTTDVMSVLLDALGMSDDTMRLIIIVKNRIGDIAGVSSIMKEKNINIHSFVTWPEKDHENTYQLVMRVAISDGEKAISLLTEGGYKVLTGYVPNHTPYL